MERTLFALHFLTLLVAPLTSTADPMCQDRNPPANGWPSTSCRGLAVGESCRFYCNPGFKLVGEGTSKCVADDAFAAKWKDPAPTCQVTCRYLLSPFNGRAVTPCTGREVGESCEFECDDGFRLVGNRTAKCIADGAFSAKWEDPAPECIAMCKDRSPPTNGWVVMPCTGLAVGESCQFECNDGFKLVGEGTSNCVGDGMSTAKWEDPSPTCTAKTCLDLTAPKNGDTNCINITYGERCSFVCDDGFEIKGQRSLFCVVNQAGDAEWSDSQPICLARCPELTTEELLKDGGTCNSAIAGDTCVVKCKENLQITRGDERELSGLINATCLESGLWDVYPKCTATCPKLQPLNGLVVDGTCKGAVAGEECTVRCSENLQLMNVNQRVASDSLAVTCRDSGTWDAEPWCRELEPVGLCPNLLVPTGGHMAGDCREAKPGAICLFACQSGRRMLGEAVLACRDNLSWDLPPPTCADHDCQSTKTGGRETWVDACERQNRPCFVDPKEGPRCGCDEGLTEICTCTRKTKLLEGFLSLALQGRSKK